MATIAKFSIIEYGKNSELSQLTEGDWLVNEIVTNQEPELHYEWGEQVNDSLSECG